MKKIIINCRIMLLLACVLALTESYAYAQYATTKAQIEFVKGEGPTSPVDPDKPEIPTNGGDETTGSLVIVDVSDFDFDSVEIGPGNQSYGTTTFRPNIQVADLRGTGAGWKVSASLTRFAKGGVPSLPGASIGFFKGIPNSLSISDAPVQKDKLELTSDEEPLLIINAPEGAGTDLWVMRWYPETKDYAYITLNVPAGSATLGNHSATINWVLEDTPSSVQRVARRG